MNESFKLFNMSPTISQSLICQDIITQCKQSGITLLFKNHNDLIVLLFFIICLIIYLHFRIENKLKDLCFIKKYKIKGKNE